MSPDEYCQKKTASSGSSFYYSFLFLPKDQRQAITALYCFCREVDDIVDECNDIGVARVKLQWWRDQIKMTFDGNADHPVGQALQTSIQHFNLPLEYFIEIIDGMEMDLDQSNYPSFKELHLYCHRVAGVVGLMSAEIFGYKDRQTLKYAHELGLAFQLTNILRDVREDADRGRIYIPQELLQEFSVTENDLLSHKTTENIQLLFTSLANRAEGHYISAFNYLPEEDRYPQRCGIIMAVIYRSLLNEIKLEGYRVLEQRTKLTPLRKLWLAWRTYRQEKHRQHNYLKAT